jgi:hypothetical protein
MVTTASSNTWVSYTTGTTSNVLYGTSLNYNFWYLTSLINKGITGANIATAGIDAGALIAGGIITHGHVTFVANGGLKCVQIGKSTTFTGKMVACGAVVVSSNTAISSTDVTITFTAGDGMTAGDTFRNVPIVYATVMCGAPSTVPVITVKAAATNTANINFQAWTSQMTQGYSIKWMAIGDV